MSHYRVIDSLANELSPLPELIVPLFFMFRNKSVSNEGGVGGQLTLQSFQDISMRF